MACQAGERQDVGAEPVQDLVEALRRFGRRLVQALLHLRPAGAADYRPVRDGGEPVYQHIHRPVAETAHRFGIEPERVVVHTASSNVASAAEKSETSPFTPSVVFPQSYRAEKFPANQRGVTVYAA